MARERVLIVRIAALGDIAVASTLVRRIRADRPDAHIAWLCGDAAAPLVRLFPGVDEVIAIRGDDLLAGTMVQRVAALADVWRQLIGRRFDHVMLVHADRRYRLLLLPIVGARTAALSHDPRHPNPLPSRFRGDEYARLWENGQSTGPIPLTYDLLDVRSALGHSPATHEHRTKPRIVLVPGGARNALRDDALRRWPAERFRELAERLIGAGYDVVLLGDAKDGFAVEHFDGLPVTDHIGKLSLIEALRVLSDASVVVSPDSGPLHLARLVRVPAVALFGPTDPRQMVGDRAVAGGIHVLWGGESLACRPCYDGRNYAACRDNICMKGISVDAVFNAIAGITSSSSRA